MDIDKLELIYSVLQILDIQDLSSALKAIQQLEKMISQQPSNEALTKRLKKIVQMVKTSEMVQILKEITETNQYIEQTYQNKKEKIVYMLTKAWTENEKIQTIFRPEIIEKIKKTMLERIGQQKQINENNQILKTKMGNISKYLDELENDNSTAYQDRISSFRTTIDETKQSIEYFADPNKMMSIQINDLTFPPTSFTLLTKIMLKSEKQEFLEPQEALDAFYFIDAIVYNSLPRKQ